MHEPNVGIAQQLQAFYASFDQTSLQALATIYHPQVEFMDPIHHVSGLAALQNYFQNIMQGVQACRFEFSQVSCTDDQLFLVWQMKFQHPNLAKGQWITVDGVSHCKIQDNCVIYQRDYYDAGAMVYEHVPVLRYVLGKIKQRLNSA